jgi:predicted FMN-binding regulatory protein PaiB
VEVQFVPDETGSALFRLAAALEGSGADAWTPNAMGSRYEQLKERIIAFRARIQETHARFKLGQDEPDLTFREITEGLADRQLAEWMRRTRA